MGAMLWVVAMVVPISAAAWSAPQFGRTYGKVCLIAAIGAVLVGLIAWSGLAQRGEYAGIRQFFYAGAITAGLVTGCATQLWIIVHREGGPPRPNERKVRFVFAGLSVAALVVMAQGI